MKKVKKGLRTEEAIDSRRRYEEKQVYTPTEP